MKVVFLFFLLSCCLCTYVFPLENFEHDDGGMLDLHVFKRRGENSLLFWHNNESIDVIADVDIVLPIFDKYVPALNEYKKSLSVLGFGRTVVYIGSGIASAGATLFGNAASELASNIFSLSAVEKASLEVQANVGAAAATAGLSIGISAIPLILWGRQALIRAIFKYNVFVLEQTESNNYSKLLQNKYNSLTFMQFMQSDISALLDNLNFDDRRYFYDKHKETDAILYSIANIVPGLGSHVRKQYLAAWIFESLWLGATMIALSPIFLERPATDLHVNAAQIAVIIWVSNLLYPPLYQSIRNSNLRKKLNISWSRKLTGIRI